MSAIAGLLSLDRQTLDVDPAERMVAALASRGPHDDGSYRSPDGRAVLAARRLATIDVSRNAAQPLANETHDLWLALDGEVLNHRALRHSLELVGHRFRSASDAEVAVHAYEQWGLDFLTHLQGAFALALWDDRRDRLVLARDRLGRKPLFLTERRGLLAFASGIGPLLDELKLPRGIDAAALGQYLAFGFVPAPLTLAADITKLAAGEMLVAERGSRPRRRYWGKPEPEQARATGIRALASDRHLGNLRTLLECSIADRLIGDAPLGLLLDGGPAAGAVASVVARFTGRTEIAVAVTDAADPDGVTAREMRLLAGWAGCDLIELPAGGQDFAAALPALLAALPEPMADPALPFAWFAARGAAAAGLRVLLSGTGAEEVLLSHPAYDGARRSSLAARLAALMRGTDRGDALSPPPALAPFAAEGWSALLGPAALGRIPAPTPTAGPAPAWMVADRLAACGLNDLKGRMADSAAPGLDSMLQGHGIEGRLPFLDETLLYYLLAAPASLRTPAGLRRLLGDLAPASSIARATLPALPLGAWLAGEPGEGLSSRPLVAEGVISAASVAALLAQQRRGDDRVLALWALLLLLAWTEMHGLERLTAGQGSTTELAHSRS